jgi:hypothetical protein
MYKYTSELRADELGIKLLLCHFLRKYVLFSVIDARVIFRFPICCCVIFEPPYLHFFTQNVHFPVIDARVIFKFPI